MTMTTTTSIHQCGCVFAGPGATPVPGLKSCGVWAEILSSSFIPLHGLSRSAQGLPRHPTQVRRTCPNLGITGGFRFDLECSLRLNAHGNLDPTFDVSTRKDDRTHFF